MVHLAVHLPREAMLARPVQYRWMYPIERFLGILKGYVTNRARPEGSIAEAYIAKESVNFMKMAPNVSDGELNMAHWFVLYNAPEVTPYLEEHKRQVNKPEGRNITNLQQEEFSGWFRDHINQLRSQGSPEATDALWALANGAASGAFEGEYASTFAIDLGSHIRRLVPLNKETWAAIDDGCKEAIFTAAAQKYDFGDWKTDARVAIAVGKLAMHTYREFRAELHKAYKKLLEKGHDPKQYPYDTQRTAQWVWLIENKWETPEWKRKSQRNSESRSKVKTLHTAGSRSFAAQFSIMQADEQ
ncbi:hypothetical protein AAC387_Pa05g0908 [Persea americana]